MVQPELSRLIINNLADLDVTMTHVIEELEPAVNTAMDEILKTFVSKVEWAGAADSRKNVGWLAPRDWRKPGGLTGDDFESRFLIDVGSAKAGGVDRFWLTQLLGIGYQNVGLRWVKSDVKNKRQWKLILGQQTAIIAGLRARGFEYDAVDGSFFLPVRIDQGTLAQAVADESPAVALNPFEIALQVCVDSKADFDALREATRDAGGPAAQPLFVNESSSPKAD
jgi:hypothetical protein